MTETTKAEARGTPPVATVMISESQHGARELARELADMRANGVRLDEAKEPGGRYRGTDGREHDAHGVPIDDDSDIGELSADDAAEELRELEERRAALLSRIPAARAAEGAKAEADAAARDEKARQAATAPAKRK